MDKKLFILISIFITFTLIFIVHEVNANWLANGACERSTTCTISKQLVNDTTGVSISIASCNITIRSPINTSSILTNNQPMTNLSDGFYTYDISFDNNGYYPSTMLCNYFTSSDTADVSFSIIDREADKKLITFPLVYILMVVGYGLLVFAFVKQEETILTIAGMILTVLGVIILQGGIDDTVNWITNAFGVINLCIGGYILVKNGIQQIEENM